MFDKTMLLPIDVTDPYLTQVARTPSDSALRCGAFPRVSRDVALRAPKPEVAAPPENLGSHDRLSPERAP